MTAIYGYVSIKNRFGVLAADDLEANRQVRVDKIKYVDKRFALAASGSDMIMNVLDSLFYLSETTRYKKYNNLSVLVSDIIKTTRYYKNATDDKINVTPNLIANEPSLVILDTKYLTLHHLKLNGVYKTDKSLDDAKLQTLNDSELHLFALAKSGFDALRPDNEVFTSTIPYFQRKIESDKLKYPNVVGKLGSIFVIRIKKVDYRSAFLSPTDILDVQIEFALR